MITADFNPLVRVLTAPLEPALAAAAVACLAQVPPLREEEWQLPAGTHAIIAAPLTVQVPGRRVRLLAAESCTVTAPGGALFEGEAIALGGIDLVCLGSPAALIVRATAAADLAAVTVRGGAAAISAPALTVSRLEVGGTDAEVGVDLHGDSVTVTGVAARLAARAAGTQIGVLATATSTLALSDVTVDGVHAPAAIGIEASAPRVNLGALTVNDVGQTGAAAGTASGVVVVAADALVVTRLRISSVAGARAVGASLAVAGDAHQTGQGLRALDLTVDGIAGGAFAAGLVLGSDAPADLRGFTVQDVRGDAAMAVLAFVGHGLATTVGEVSDVYGKQGRAVGVRVLAAPSLQAVSVGDLAVQSVGRRPGAEPDDGVAFPGPLPVPPDDAWDSWPEQALGGLRAVASDLAVAAAQARAPTWKATPRVRAAAVALPAFPAGPEIVGVHVGAWVDEARAADGIEVWGGVHFQDGLVSQIAGPALQLAGGLRPLTLARTELSFAAAAGWVQGEEALLAELTVHRHGSGLVLGAGTFVLVDDIVSGVAAGPSFPLEPDAERVSVAAVFTTSTDAAEDHRFMELGPLPFVDPGPDVLPADLAAGVVPPALTLDLRLLADAAVARRAVPLPGPEQTEGTSGAFFLGAYEPDAPPRCATRDPEPHLWALPSPAVEPALAVDYRGRDNAALLDLMRARAQVSMPTWTERGPADFVTMLFEILSNRLDVEAYAQERALAEGFLETARLRRSVEDHARVLDYPIDPGLSATAMLAFKLDLPEAEQKALLDGDGSVLIPADTMVGTVDAQEASVIFATEESLQLVPALDRLQLSAPCPAGATVATLKNNAGAKFLKPGRWLVFHTGPHDPGHVVRITVVDDGQPETTTVMWDPRRPLPRALDADLGPDQATVLGNVVPAHHGVPLTALEEGESLTTDPLLGRWRDLLKFDVDETVGREVELPVGPVAMQARGYPLPGDEGRAGTPALRLSVDGDEWHLVDELSTADPSDEVFVLRSGEDGRATVGFGDGLSGSSLPRRAVRIAIDVRVGRGSIGNVGAARLTRLIQLGGAAAGQTALEQRLGQAGPDREDRLRQILRVNNPLAAVGGRDAEALSRIRYRAPFTVMDARSAITPADYERLLGQLPTVAAARARVNTDGVRPLVRVTVLLRDEDTLDDDERLRRWADVRRQLERMRLLGCDVQETPPLWVPLDLDLIVDAAPHADAGAVEQAVREALAGNGGLLDPDRILLGGDVHLSHVYESALAVNGVVGVRVKRFRRLGPDAADRLPDGVIPIGPEEVPILRAPRRTRSDPRSDGLLTVTVCGGLR